MLEEIALGVTRSLQQTPSGYAVVATTAAS